MIKVCPYCKLEFESNYRLERYCSGDCKEFTRRDAKLEKWANGTKNTPQPKKLFRMYGLEGSNRPR